MSPADFEAARSFLLNNSKLRVQALSRRLSYAIDGQFYGRKDLVTELEERLPKLTVEQVNAAVRKHLEPPGMKIAVVARNADELRDIPTSGKPSPITYDTRGTPREYPRRGQADRRLSAHERDRQDRAGPADV